MAEVKRRIEVRPPRRLPRPTLRPRVRIRRVLVAEAANDNAPAISWRARRYLVRSAAAGALGALIWSIVS